MPRATGAIGYIEHRSPRKDENGKYIIHPQFVQKEMYDAEKMAHDSQGRCMTNGAQFVSVMDTIETLTLQALGRGDAVRYVHIPLCRASISFMDIILVILESAFLANTKYFAENLLIIC